jgi:hypothetical protein
LEFLSSAIWSPQFLQVSFLFIELRG